MRPEIGANRAFRMFRALLRRAKVPAYGIPRQVRVPSAAPQPKLPLRCLTWRSHRLRRTSQAVLEPSPSAARRRPSGPLRASGATFCGISCAVCLDRAWGPVSGCHLMPWPVSRRLPSVWRCDHALPCSAASGCAVGCAGGHPRGVNRAQPGRAALRTRGRGVVHRGAGRVGSPAVRVPPSPGWLRGPRAGRALAGRSIAIPPPGSPGSGSH